MDRLNRILQAAQGMGMSSGAPPGAVRTPDLHAQKHLNLLEAPQKLSPCTIVVLASLAKLKLYRIQISSTILKRSIFPLLPY